MKKKLSLTLVWILWLALQPVPALVQNPETLVKQAEQAYGNKEYAQSAQLFLKAFRLRPDDSGLLYNAACAEALAGQKNEAFARLEQLVKLGFGRVSQLQNDTDLQSLHADTRWKSLLEAATRNETRFNQQWNNPALRTAFRENLSEEEKIAGLSKLWSEVRFNFANFDLVPDLNWDALYLSTLPKVRQTKSTLEYYRVLQETVAALKDGHSRVRPPRELLNEFFSAPGLSTALLENRLIIRRVLDPKLQEAGLKPSLEILEINGVPVHEYAEKRVKPLVPASTPQDLESQTFGFAILIGPPQEPLELTLQDAQGAPFKKSVPRLPAQERFALNAKNTPLLQFKVLEGNIGFLTLNSFNDEKIKAEFDAVWPQIQQTEGLIIDIRANGGGNSSNGWYILAHLTDKPFKTSKWRTRLYRPSFRAWGRGESWHIADDSEVGPEGKNPYLKPVAVLISPQTYSAAEDFAVPFDFMKRGLLIGQPTGGSTGQPLNVDLPGGGSAGICTKRDTYPDGKEFVGVGVQPNIVVKPTVADFRAGRDVAQETALQELRKLAVRSRQ